MSEKWDESTKKEKKREELIIETSNLKFQTELLWSRNARIKLEHMF